MLPNLFIPGAPKCGTSALANYLASHPSVFIGHVKEPNFWSSDMPFFARREGFSSEAQYADMYAEASPQATYRIDASTHYLYSETAIPRIVERIPHARFIVMVRRGQDIAHAWHMQMFNAGYEDVADFETAWNLIDDRSRGKHLPAGCPETRLLDYRAVASVGSQVDRLMRFVSADKVLLLSLEKMKRDARAAYLRCLEFLDLADDGRTVFEVENAAAQNRAPWLSRMIRNPRIRPGLNRALSLVDPAFARHSKDYVKRLLYRKQRRTALSAGFTEQLDREFRADADLLSCMLNDTTAPDNSSDDGATETRVPADGKTWTQHPT